MKMKDKMPEKNSSGMYDDTMGARTVAKDKQKGNPDYFWNGSGWQPVPEGKLPAGDKEYHGKNKKA